MDHYINMKCKNHKTFRKKQNNLWNLGLGQEFLALTPKTQSIKGKTDNLDFIKT